MNAVRLAIAWGLARQPQLPGVLGMALLGLCGALWLGGTDADEWFALEAELAQWQARLPAPAASTPWAGQAGAGGGAAPQGGVFTTPWPQPQQTVALWPWLQQGAQIHGLQVLALRPQKPDKVGVVAHALPEQTLLLHVQGRWPDWQAWSQTWPAQAPWLLPTQWQVVPAGAGANEGEVRIELQARVGLWPSALQDTHTPAWSALPWPLEQTAPGAGAGPFGGHVDSGPAVVAPGPSSLSSDPGQWPVQAIRLQGVWQQAGQWHAVLGAGLSQTTVRAGQQLGHERYLVHKVGMDGVALRAVANGAVLHLTWQGGKP